MTLYEFRRLAALSLLSGALPGSASADVSCGPELARSNNDRLPRKRKQDEVAPEIKSAHGGHLPQYMDYKLHCRQCKMKTFWRCDRCNVHLCLVKDRKCFQEFHD